MSVQNFECQIAKAQIGRYLSGDQLSGEAMEQLEDHIAGCPDCKQTLAEKRASLQAMLGLGSEPVIAAEVEVRAKPLTGWLKTKALEQFKQAEPAKTPSGAPSAAKFKTGAYSVALAVVLVGMSYLSKNPNVVMGGKAIDMAPSATPPRTAVTTTLTPTTQSTQQSTPPKTLDLTPEKPVEQPSTGVPRAEALASLADATTEEKPTVTEPEHPAPKPAVTVRRTAPKPRAKRRAVQPPKKVAKPAPKPAPKASSGNSIRVYDADGKPISN